MAEFFSQFVPDWLANLLSPVVSPEGLGYFLAAFVHVNLVMGLVAVSAMVFIWMERKIAGRIQDRLGPTRVGGRFGWLQTLADGIKLLQKEDLAPSASDKFLFRIAPYISFVASLGAFMALPFSAGAFPWVGIRVNIAIFFLLAVMGLEVFGVILAGYSSASKWSLFGAMREAAQVVSYEVPLGMCIVVPVLLAGSMDLTVIGQKQAGFFTNWYVFHDPFTFITFWVYVTCAIASVNRAPFDLAEAESELVAGFHTEYSGFRWSVFFMAEYGSMLVVSILASILFLGAWNGPIPIFDIIGWSQAAGETATLTGYLAALAGCINVLIKAFAAVTVMMWVRWTFPRLRIDQVITTCLKYCTPIAAAMFLGVVGWQVWFQPNIMPGNTFFGLLSSPEANTSVDEGWKIPGQAQENTTKEPKSKPAVAKTNDASPKVSDENRSQMNSGKTLDANLKTSIAANTFINTVERGGR